MGGSITSAKYGNTIYLYFEWSSTTKSQGVSTVTWSLKGKGAPAFNATYFWTKATLKVRGATQWTANDVAVYYNNKTLASGSFDLEHGTNGEAQFSAQLTVSKIYSTGVTSDEKETFTISGNYPYTDCEAPSSITCDEPFVKPGGEVTVRWSGADGGTANGITAYRVRYKPENSTVWWDTATIETTATSGSKTFSPLGTALSNHRGERLVVEVQTRGAAGSDYYASEEVTTGTKVNNLPSRPSAVTASPMIVPSSGGAVTFAITPGRDSTDSQTLSPHYSTSSNSTKRSCGGNTFSQSVTGRTTYKFWNSDGLEFSSTSRDITININSVPNISALTLSSSNNMTNVVATVGGTSGGQSSNNTYTFGITYNNQDRAIATQVASTSYTIVDARAKIYEHFGALTAGQTYSYKVWAKRHDGIEEGPPCYSQEVSFAIPSVNLPSLGADGTVISQPALASYFSKTLDFAIGDQTFPCSWVEVEGSKYNLANGKLVNPTTIDVSSLPEGREITQVGLKYQGDMFFVNLSQRKTKIVPFVIAPSRTGGRTSPFSPLTLKPYSTHELMIDILNGQPYQGLEETIAPNINLSLATDPSVSVSLSGTYINNHYQYSISGPLLCSYFLDELLVQGATWRIKIANAFGDEYFKDFTQQLNFAEQPEVIENWSEEGSGKNMPCVVYPGVWEEGRVTYKHASFDYWEYVKEGMPIFCDLIVTAPREPQVTIEWRQLDSENRPRTSFEQLGTLSCTKAERTAHVYNDSPTDIYVFSGRVEDSLPQIADDGYAEFRATITGNKDFITTTHYLFGKFPIKAHVEPQVVFMEVEVKDKTRKTVGGKFHIENNGHSVPGQNAEISFLCREKDKKYYSLNVEAPLFETLEDAFAYSDGSNGRYSYVNVGPIASSGLTVRLKDRNNLPEEIALPPLVEYFRTTKTNIEPWQYIVVYDSSPTVSYRQNCVGINTTSPGETTAFEVQPSSARQTARFGEATIDLMTGQQTGFSYTIKGQWWDRGRTAFQERFISSVLDKRLKNLPSEDYALYVERIDEPGKTYKLATADYFVYYDYLPNNQDKIVPVFYITENISTTQNEFIEGPTDKQVVFFYVETVERFDSETNTHYILDKWRKIEGSGSLGWDDDMQVYLYTHPLVS